jgi:predicted lactoylglutathione lyase
MTSIDAVILEVPDPDAASAFYSDAFGLGDRLGFRASDAPSSGFRAFTLSLVVSQPATVDKLLGAAVEAGATPLKPTKRSMWGYGGVVQAPDGTIWKAATSSKKNTGPATAEVDDVVLLLGVEDVAASKRFYVERGLEVARSFARAYVEFDTAPIKLALYKRRALAKDAGVSGKGTGSRRLVICGDAGPLTDPDGFGWEAPPEGQEAQATMNAMVETR